MEFLWMKKRVGEYQSQEGGRRFLKVVAMFGSLKKKRDTETVKIHLSNDSEQLRLNQDKIVFNSTTSVETDSQ